ncbi:MAG: hypothetical protein HY831_03275 [Candidatus Aenigmarchaeota archaeon]|nr:hypothetical protein [Candidatus Aenigmarchaeota archaeon]
MKGISLALETVILLILMAVVLAALMAFFLGVFNPSKTQLDTIRDKESTCVQYISRDPGCEHADAIVEGTEPYNTDKYRDAKTAIGKLKTICRSTPDNPPCGIKTCDSPSAVVKACCVSFCR